MKTMNALKRIFPLLLGICCCPVAAAPPRLVVQIVVGSMRAGDLDRYAAHFGEGGFRRLVEGGARYTGARYDYQQTTTPVALATLTTGAMPSTHGVIGSRWQDYTDNRTVWLTDGRQGPGPYRLIAPTLGETLLQHAPDGRCATVAAEAESAVVMGGRAGEVYWLDPQHGGWTTSYYYASELPEWLARNNRQRYHLSYLDDWRTLYDRNSYLNTRHWDIFLSGSSRKSSGTAGAGRLRLADDYERLLYTPAGNTAVLDLAKQLIVRCRLGGDAVPDLLNICLDPARRISEAYGPESVEVEDMFCRLDRDLADFLTFLFAQVGEDDVLVILASDHGTSPSYDLTAPAADRFNARQFEVIVNGFLNVRYGAGDWVTDCNENSLWLNHNLIYERGLNLADVQNEVATFAMQFGGVSHALAATAMRTGYFGSGYARRMQNSFYPRRSGDVVINLLPGWIGERERCHSSSGSMYGYDTDVPLLFYGAGIEPQRIRRRVDMTSVAPTAARFLEISEPAASEGEPLEEIIE